MTVLAKFHGAQILSRGSALLLLTALCMSTSSGCKKASSPDMSASPAMQGAAGPTSDDPLAELDALENRMAALGLEVAPKQERAKRPVEGGGGGGDGAGAGESPDDADGGEDMLDAGAVAPDAPTAVEESEAAPEPTTTASDEPNFGQPGDRCTDLCSLNESICELEVRICSLSDSHGDDPIYADACERAVDDCDTAGDACDHCAD